MMKKQQSRRRGAVICCALLVLTAAALWLGACSGRFPRLEAAGFRVTREEYLRAMYQARNEVLSDHAAAGISLTDWSAETALGDPCRLVTRRALEILAEYYAVGTLAVERGYLADAGYDAMLEDLQQVNRKRQEALDSGGVVTGLPSFTTEEYLTYRASNIRMQFCSDGSNPENQVTDEQIRARYEADRENLYSLPDALELAFLEIDAAPEEAAARKAELEDLRQLALERGDLALALEERQELKAYYGQITVDQSSYSIYARSHGDILACAEGLGTGDISEVFEQEGWLCLLQCRARREQICAPLEEVESIVVQSIRESRYDDLIARRMEQMQIDTDLQALYRFTADQLS